MRLRLPSLAVLATFLAVPVLSAAAPKALDGAYSFKKNGWTYVHLQGSPSDIGFQHGYLLSAEIEDNYHVYRLEQEHNSGRDWSFFRAASKTVLWPNIEPEYRAELEGIAAGLKAKGSSLDLWDVVAINGNLELGDYYLPWLNKKEGKPNPPKDVAPGKCSAFIAAGSATRDGKIVVAHSNWSPYAEGERWTIVFDIAPAKGLRFLMDGAPGIITSQDDFGVNAAGLMITETTLPMAAGWDLKGAPEFVRSRKAMQYAHSIDEYAAIMRDRNNGGYANSWLVGDRKTGEIAYLELGLKHTPLTRKKDGYFVSSNFAANPDLIRDDTPGFDTTNKSSSMNARHLRADAFMQQHKGQMDTELAEAFLSDHIDTFVGGEKADQRSLCGHVDKAKEGEPVWGEKPYEPMGAVTGKVMDSDLAGKMSFIARAGHPCGDDFLVAPFLAAHPEFQWEKPILNDMKAGPWTTFTTAEAVTR
ncbi:C45 family autoproteolytic acyltransferase/hydolase [Granulicella arctica]|uniref:C45 family autoproteolytic acyltransferase/hydolase n=1 Tax=Granulicella arctica TaxID=940613 RepID=UPI0021E0E175|nr:C45 family peptidase [Granulicella arctica]